MISFRRFWMPGFLAIFISLTTLSALADPPSRAVRVKYISGAVSMQPGGVDDWVPAVVNRPLTTSDRVWTDKEARAELHLGSAALRMNAETSLTLTNVSDDIVQVELDQGTLNLHIRHLFGGESYEIDTPNQAFTILKAGDYRFDVDPNADTTSVTVWKGEGEANGQGPGVRMRSGHQATFSGGTSLEHQVASAPGLDGFDDWCRVRDDREDHAKSYQYVSSDVVGADDLDEYGTWRVESAYGPVWVPTVAPGWAPYRNGHWVWVEPWGWTWVDEAPWGFAPCHYGRWVHIGGYWAWAPGPVVVARPVYAPALVAWVGGPRFGVSLSVGGGSGVAWFPLGWGEPYVPSYHVSRTYFQQVNVTNTRIVNITHVTNNYYVNNTTVVNNNVRNIHYVNQNVTGAVTAVPTRAMTNSEPVARAAIAVPAGELRNASVVNTVEVAPARTSVLGARAGAQAPLPSNRIATVRPVVSRVAPPARPVPFEVRREALEKTPGRPLDAQTESRLRSNMARPAAPAAQAAPQPAQTVTPGTPTGVNPRGGQPRPGMRPDGPQMSSGNTSADRVKPATTEVPKAQDPMQPVRPGSPMATSPSGIQRRPVPRPGMPQKSYESGAGSDEKSATTAAPTAQELKQPVRPGSPMATSPIGNQPRPVARPDTPQTSYGNGNSAPTSPGSLSAPSNAGRAIPRPTQTGRPYQETPNPTPDVAGTVSRPAQNSAAPNMGTSRSNPSSMPRPGAPTGSIRPSVDTARPSAPRTAQPVSMPRAERQASAPSSPARTEARPSRENNQRNNREQQKHEDKSDRRQNR